MEKTRAEIDRRFLAKIRKPLVFGDSEQIKLLNAWRTEVDNFEELERQRNDPVAPLRRWRVGFTYREEKEEIVEARSEQEAKEMIKEDGYEDLDIDYIELIKERNINQKTK